MVDFTTYQPPGVYIEENVSTMVNVLGIRPTVVALVGPSVGYRKHTEAVILTGTDPMPLAKLGIDTDSVVVTSADGTAYAVTTDYSLVATAGEDGTVETGEDNATTLARVTDSDVADGATVYVTYNYTDTDYHNPLRTASFGDVQDAFGAPIDLETGEIISPLSFAAKIAFENGARNLVLVPTSGTDSDTVTRSELSAAYSRLDAMDDVNIIVPIPVGITGTSGSPGDTYGVGTDLRGYVEGSITNGQRRVGIVGFDSGVTVDPVTAASNFRSSRVMLAYPNALRYFHGYRNITTEVGGCYLAAAYAGIMAGNPVQTPLTRKAVSGFSGISSAVANAMTLSNRNTWSSGGVAVAEVSRSGALVIRHATSTDNSSTLTREMSLVRAKDTLVDLLYATVDTSGLIGGYVDDDTPSAILGLVTGVLETAKGSDIVVDYNNVQIRQANVDPTVFEVQFAYRPAYPLNYIVISFSIDTSTGVVDAVTNFTGTI